MMGLGLSTWGGGPPDLGEPLGALDSLVLRIRGRLLTGYIDGSLSISAALSVRDTFRLHLADTTGAIDIEPGEAVELYRLGELIFAGTVDSVSDEYPVYDGASLLHRISLECVDWNQLADRRLVTEAYAAQPAEDIIADLVQTYLGADGISTGGIEATGITIGPIRISYRRLSEVLDEIAQLIGYGWNIEYSKEFRFFARESYDAPWPLLSDERRYGSLVIERGRDQYRNVQIVRGAKDIGAARTREFAGDGDTSTWDVDMPIGEQPAVYVDDVQKTVGIRGVHDEDDPAGYAWFWAKGETAVSQNVSGSKLTSSNTLKVVYKPLIPIILTASDYVAIGERQGVEGGSGLYEAAAENAQIEDAGLGYEYALSFLRRYAQVRDVIRVVTSDWGIKPGHLQQVQLEPEGIDDTFLVESVEATEQAGIWSISYRALNCEAAGGWPEFFKRLARSGADFSLSAERDIIKVSQSAESFKLSDEDDSATGSSLSAISADAYTAAQIPTARIGHRYSEAGVTYNRGSRIGDYTHKS